MCARMSDQLALKNSIIVRSVPTAVAVVDL
jgi:hypothetical protein